MLDGTLGNGLRFMREIGVFEAKTKLNQLLDQVEAGEEIVIIRRGKIVARLVPPTVTMNRERARAAVTRIRARRKGVTRGGITIKELIEEGRA